MKTLRTLMLIACCICWLGEAWCQKKEINAAKDQLKAGNNLPQAQQSLETLLKDSVNRNNLKIWSLLYDIVVKQYEQGNEKLYLKQAYDTASLFNLAKKLFEVAEGLDSVEMEPDKKGRVRLKYRNDHSEYLHMIRPNLLSGGLWMIGKQRYAEAYRFWTSILIAHASLSLSQRTIKRQTLICLRQHTGVYIADTKCKTPRPRSITPMKH